MRRYCGSCNRSYDDEYCSTVCPHKGMGHCAVCDCVVCVCSSETSRDWERSSNNYLRKPTERETEVLRVFEKAMKEVTIPEILRARREREEAWQKIKNTILD